MRRYTTRDVAELLGLSPAHIRGFARSGFLSPERGPRGAYRFSFQDIILLRAAKELVSAQIAPTRIRNALLKLRSQLPTGRPLTAVRIVAQGDRVVVRDAGTLWQPESGQFQFDFAVSEMADQLAPVARRVAGEAHEACQSLDSDGWYNLGFELEPVEPNEARAAYRRAVELDPLNAEAHINLGRLLQAKGCVADAEIHYRRALEAAPENPTAAFNLGTVLEDTKRPDEAAQAYLLAIKLDPNFVDAHFNLARLYEAAGKLEAAIRHLRSCKVLSKAT